MLLDGRLAAAFLLDVHHFGAAAREQIIHVVGDAMELLCADDQVHVRELVNEFLAPALRHAAEEAEDDAGALFAELPGEILHLANGLLLGVVAHAASVEQHDIGGGFGGGEGIALGDELGGDGFAVALVHLATVGLDEDAGHENKTARRLGTARRAGKRNVSYSVVRCLSHSMSEPGPLTLLSRRTTLGIAAPTESRVFFHFR